MTSNGASTSTIRVSRHEVSSITVTSARIITRFWKKAGSAATTTCFT